MRSTAHLSGHPIHPMLVGFPAAYLLGNAWIDAWARATNRPSWFRTARHLNTLGLGAALVAAVPGLIDYVFTIPPRSSAQKRATDHMFANVSALILFAAARAGRREEDVRPSWWRVATELCGSGLLTAAGWMGGTLVFRNQIAVDHRHAGAGKWRSKTIAAIRNGSGAIDVGADDQLDADQMMLLHIEQRRIVLARTGAGYVAFDDRCTHKGGPLSDGSLACGIVQCPWHGSQFDTGTGAVKHGPADAPVHIYSVSQRDGRVWIELPGDGDL
jgi:nitrite reductase/ring-hydroxylating ferredoxin subunit/uncharacterized membrane protein